MNKGFGLHASMFSGKTVFSFPRALSWILYGNLFFMINVSEEPFVSCDPTNEIETLLKHQLHAMLGAYQHHQNEYTSF